MPMIFPHSTSLFVTSISSLEGAGSPDGWLWIQIMDAAERRNASLNTSRGCTMEAFKLPIKMV